MHLKFTHICDIAIYERDKRETRLRSRQRHVRFCDGALGHAKSSSLGVCLRQRLQASCGEGVVVSTDPMKQNEMRMLQFVPTGTYAAQGRYVCRWHELVLRKNVACQHCLPENAWRFAPQISQTKHSCTHATRITVHENGGVDHRSHM